VGEQNDETIKENTTPENDAVTVEDADGSPAGAPPENDEAADGKVSGQTDSEENFTGGREPMSPRKRAAWIRCTCGVCAALLLLCLTGFGVFKLMLGGKNLSAENITGGRYLTFKVDTIIDYLSTEYKADSSAATPAVTGAADTATDTQTDQGTAVGRYAVIPVGGRLAVVHFPQRYLDSADQIAMQTYYQLYGYTSADSYFEASGTVKKAPEDIAAKYKTWYNTNALALYQYGFVNSLDQTEITYYIDVDSTGLFSDNVCIAMSAAAALCLVYALIVFILIKAGKFSDDITVEIIQKPDGGTDDDELSEDDGTETEDEPEKTEAPAEEAEEKPEDRDDA